MRVTAVDSARYAEVFAQCYVATDAGAVDEQELAAALRDLDARPGVDGYVTETFCVQLAVLPALQRSPDRRHPRRDRTRLPRVGPLPGAADQPDRGGRPGRLDDRRADGLREAVGAPIVPAARAASARAAPRIGPGACGATRASWPRRWGRSTSRTWIRPTTSTVTSPTTTSGKRSSRGMRRCTTASRASASTPVTPRRAASSTNATGWPTRWRA